MYFGCYVAMSFLPITGVVLAGGAGHRMGGMDKGWVEWAGEPLIIHALRRCAGLSEVLISANRSLKRYHALGYPVVVDETADFGGPLRGLHQALRVAHQPWVATIPVDSPLLPLDIVAQLWAARGAASVIVARSVRGPEAVISLCARHTLQALEDYLATGGRKAQEWFGQLPHTWLELPVDVFKNCNTVADLTDHLSGNEASER